MISACVGASKVRPTKAFPTFGSHMRMSEKNFEPTWALCHFTLPMTMSNTMGELALDHGKNYKNLFKVLLDVMNLSQRFKMETIFTKKEKIK